MKQQIKIISFIFLSLLGAVLSYTLLLNHFSLDISPCAVNATFNCDIVNRSIYAEIVGVPVALVGLLGYSFLFLLSAQFLFFKNNIIPWLLFIFSVGGFVFSLYLTGIETFILHTYCPYCLISQGIISVLVILSYYNWRVFTGKN